ncbi:hypothetical protein NDU88_001799 [Pleurodeles waltl]|uniref:Uncharacterized protein n=1 Tax=Pleurodeles waltl TaxID=8319 RepID=A0AAV7UBB4_PLEWA|nr:hypothetical protein NDU88_001799 [Pleurodeles waltl]
MVASTESRLPAVGGPNFTATNSTPVEYQAGPAEGAGASTDARRLGLLCFPVISSFLSRMSGYAAGFTGSGDKCFPGQVCNGTPQAGPGCTERLLCAPLKRRDIPGRHCGILLKAQDASRVRSEMLGSRCWEGVPVVTEGVY